MKKKLIAYGYCFLVLVFIYSCSSNNGKNKTSTKKLTQMDGPYIYDKNDSLTILEIEKVRDSVFYAKMETVKKDSTLQFVCNVENTDKDSFSFGLMQRYAIPDATYAAKDRIFVTSDIEGNFNTFYSMLVGNKVMDKNYNWTFGDGHLVIAGDMVDRGDNVMPCLWLLYKLEKNAKTAGGQVHYILGNHDVMNLQLDIRYVRPKYIDLAKVVSGETDEKLAFKYLMSNSNELVKWIKSKNAIEKIGNNLFLHGGISEEIVDAGLSLEQINDYVRKHIHELLIVNPGDDEYANLILGEKGPLWYRGLVKDHKDNYEKISRVGLANILGFYDVDHIIIGHTIVDDEVTSDFNGKVIRVDIKHPGEKFTGKSQALLIENGEYSKVNDKGDKFILPI